MKKSLLALSLLLTVHGALSETPYFRVGMGISTPSESEINYTYLPVNTENLNVDFIRGDIDFDSDIGLNVAFGVENFSGVKVEGVFSVQENEATVANLYKLDLNTRTLGLNLIKELGDEKLVPFVNAGAGFVFSEFKWDASSLKDTTMYFNLGAGFTYALSSTVDLHAGYSYYFIGDPEDTFVTPVVETLDNDNDGYVDSYDEYDLIYDAEVELGMHQFVVGIAASF